MIKVRTKNQVVKKYLNLQTTAKTNINTYDGVKTQNIWNEFVSSRFSFIFL
jgi:hypothetical protein